MVKTLTLALGSGVPAWAGWSFGQEQGIMIAWWMAVVGFSVGWFFSRKIVSEFLD